MIKRLLTILLAFITLTATAQVQTGVVKTKGYPDRKGKPISGAEVKIKEANRTTTDKDGKFKVRINGKTFKIEKVAAKGYQLCNYDVLRQSYQYPVKDFSIALETTADNIKQRSEITNSITISRAKEVEKLRAENERLKEAGKRTEKEYQEVLQKLIDYQLKDISSVVEEYMKIDWDKLNDFNRLFNEFIINGRIMQADSLLRTRADIAQLDQEASELATFSDRVEEHKEQVKKEESVRDMKVAELADHYNNWHKVYLECFKFDSAAYCLEKRAALKPIHCEWQNDAGRFILEYLADYNKAMHYFESALKIAQEEDNQECIATSYICLGNLYCRNYYPVYANVNYSKALKTKALDCFNKALEVRMQLYDENDPKIADVYVDIGIVYHNRRDYENALYYYQKALDIYIQSYDDSDPVIVRTCSYIYNIHYQKGDLELYKASTHFCLDCKDSSTDLIDKYRKIGWDYERDDDYGNALEYYLKDLVYKLQLFGNNGFTVASSYDNLVRIYVALNDYEKAIMYLERELMIYRLLLPKDHGYLDHKETYLIVLKSKLYSE